MTRARALAGALGLAVLLTACSPAAEEATETPTPDPTPVEMSCDTIVPTTFSSRLGELGWSAREEPFRIGEHVFDDGIQCIWGDAETGSEVAQMYGWAPADADTAAEMQEYLEAQGWIREEDGDTVYITENPDYALAVGDDGYGMTYRFRDGTIALADTKTGLELVVWQAGE
ncbi:hypothetical protein [Microbacterium sp. ZXX196]|uniref:hypothetical protein n=1 Tax=Microbacterium sp. ZXX196 TaxID=2609291 RepID=UPI0012B86246|nr:hypothetical protein [Microbacterium sp. ZXX196]MTE24753.1 hypothetical protein [Microbacterium sp. ZXX196]